MLSNFDNLFQGLTNPKGNLGDWRHAEYAFGAGSARNPFRLAPKTKFNYHVYFDINDDAVSKINSGAQWQKDRHKFEAGMLVKRCDLPKFTANVETRKKYNRVKHVQTGISYEPITMTFYDDNLGLTGFLLEAYYRYYFRDGNHVISPSAYQKAHRHPAPAISKNASAGIFDTIADGVSNYVNDKLANFSSPLPTTGLTDNPKEFNYLMEDTYDASKPLHRYGLDNNSVEPFFHNIQISQLAKHTYTTFTIVNPVITDWSYSNLDYSAGGETTENTITVSYESVFVNRGVVNRSARADEDKDPIGFGRAEHYDTAPSPMTLQGGGPIDIAGFITDLILPGETDLFDFSAAGSGFSNPMAAAIAGVNLLGQLDNLPRGDEIAADVIGNIVDELGTGGLGGIGGLLIP